MPQQDILFQPLTLPCGVTLKNRIVKSAMSDSLGDGTGHPTAEQLRLYRRWARGGLAASIIGEVQGSPDYAEKPGNLVLDPKSDLDRFRDLARAVTTRPLMLTGGFKTLAQAVDAVAGGATDVVGLARALVLEPSLPELWKAGQTPAPVFPRFAKAPEGGITAWYTMRLTEIAEDRETPKFRDLDQAIRDYEARDAARTGIWRSHFGPPGAAGPA